MAYKIEDDLDLLLPLPAGFIRGMNNDFLVLSIILVSPWAALTSLVMGEPSGIPMRASVG